MAKLAAPREPSRPAVPSQAGPGKESADALRLLERMLLFQEQGKNEVQIYVRELGKAAEDPKLAPKIQQAAGLLRNLIELRAVERRELSDLVENLDLVLEKFKEAQGAWPQAAKDLDAVAAEAHEKKTQALLNDLKAEIQKFIDSYLLATLQTLREPLKTSELSELLRHCLGQGKDDDEKSKTSVEAELSVEAIRQKYAHPLLLVKSIIGHKAMSSSATTLLNTFQELSKDFPPVQDDARGRRYLVKVYEHDPFLRENIQKACEALEGQDRITTSQVKVSEPSPPPAKGLSAETGPAPAPLALAKTYHKTLAAKLLDNEAGSLAPGQLDLLDDITEYMHRIWRESKAWERHPMYEPLQYFRDHLVRLEATGHIMELLLRSYREVRRYQASDIVTLDTHQLLTIPSVREIVCLLVYPKLRRVPGFNGRTFRSMLGRQYSTLLVCCEDIAGLDVFVHDEWPENIDQFLKKFDATYQALSKEAPGPLRRLLNTLRRPY